MKKRGEKKEGRRWMESEHASFESNSNSALNCHISATMPKINTGKHATLTLAALKCPKYC
jgi:hypothetical protein